VGYYIIFAWLPADIIHLSIQADDLQDYDPFDDGGFRR